MARAQHKARQVRGCDQQHAHGSGKQNPQHESRLVANVVLQQDHGSADVGEFFGVAPFQLRRNAANFSAGLLHGTPRLSRAIP